MAKFDVLDMNGKKVSTAWAQNARNKLAMALELYLALELLLRIPFIALVSFSGVTALFQSFFLERIFAPYIRAQLGSGEEEDKPDR